MGSHVAQLHRRGHRWKGVFGPPGTVMEAIREGLPAVLAYFNGSNAVSVMLERTIPIITLMENAGNQTAYMVSFVPSVSHASPHRTATAATAVLTLTVPYVSLLCVGAGRVSGSPPAFTNATGFLHLNTWPTATASFSPIVVLLPRPRH